MVCGVVSVVCVCGGCDVSVVCGVVSVVCVCAVCDVNYTFMLSYPLPPHMPSIPHPVTLHP